MPTETMVSKRGNIRFPKTLLRNAMATALQAMKTNAPFMVGILGPNALIIRMAPILSQGIKMDEETSEDEDLDVVVQEEVPEEADEEILAVAMANTISNNRPLCKLTKPTTRKRVSREIPSSIILIRLARPLRGTGNLTIFKSQQVLELHE
jgi:hypothetical protein